MSLSPTARLTAGRLAAMDSTSGIASTVADAAGLLLAAYEVYTHRAPTWALAIVAGAAGLRSPVQRWPCFDTSQTAQTWCSWPVFSGPDAVQTWLLACVIQSWRWTAPMAVTGANACAHLNTPQLTVPTIGLCNGTSTEPSVAQSYCGNVIIL